MPVKKVVEDFTHAYTKPSTSPDIPQEHGPNVGHHTHSIDEEMYGGKHVSPSPPPAAQIKEMMNKTVGLKQTTDKTGAPFSLSDQHSRGVPIQRPRIGGIALDGTQDKSRI